MTRSSSRSAPPPLRAPAASASRARGAHDRRTTPGIGGHQRGGGAFRASAGTATPRSGKRRPVPTALAGGARVRRDPVALAHSWTGRPSRYEASTHPRPSTWRWSGAASAIPRRRHERSSTLFASAWPSRYRQEATGRHEHHGDAVGADDVRAGGTCPPLRSARGGLSHGPRRGPDPRDRRDALLRAGRGLEGRGRSTSPSRRSTTSVADPDLVLNEGWMKVFTVFYLLIGIGVLCGDPPPPRARVRRGSGPGRAARRRRRPAGPLRRSSPPGPAITQPLRR